MLRESRRRTDPDVAKTFVLDTNVLMHDPSSLFRFEEHDIFLPMMTLEELDNHKKGVSEVARNVRQVTRSLDAMIEAIADASDSGLNMAEGIPLSVLGNKEATGRLYFQTQPLEIETSSVIEGLTVGKADNQILGVVRALQAKQKDRLVVLVSKDINIRIKAHALGLPAEDYFNDQVIDDADLLYSGAMQLPEGFWDSHGKRLESWQQGGYTFYRVTGPLCAAFHVNQFVYEEGTSPLYALVQEVQGRTAVLRTLRDFTHAKNSVWGITARNREQNFALNLLMNPDVDFVTLLGQAGTGKTLLALASGLAQILETKIYNEIIVTRATVPLGDDIGFLPGTEEEKMQPWMGALEDNLEVLNRGVDGGGDWGRSAAADLIRTRIKIKSLNFMRGRTFINKFLIIDEAQNLTPKQMKALITRAGPGTKVVCMGNIAQIDSPYLTEGSSGLTYVVDRFKGWSHGGHVTLQRGERSRLADFATEAL
jgi:PhoH-like ATPase